MPLPGIAATARWDVRDMPLIINGLSLRKNRGFSLIEVLVTIVILAVGLLGLALLQTTSLSNQLEAYHRAQAMLLLEDMANRIRVNSVAAKAGAYPDGSPVCGSTATTAGRDLCDWNAALAGTGTKLGTKKVGSLVGTVGCIENLAGSGDGDVIIRLTIAWQGTVATVAPASLCGKDTFGSDDKLRRVASVDTVLADLAL